MNATTPKIELVRIQGVLTEFSAISDWQQPLFDEELISVQSSAATRQLEFTAGRNLARRSLENLGVAKQPLLKSRQGTVRWPRGIVGSISHSQNHVAVAVGLSKDFQSIGVDIEDIGSVSVELVADILLDSERRMLELNSELDIATLLFSCKESVYKAVSPIIGEFLEFKDVEVELNGNSFFARCVSEKKSSGLVSAGRGYIGTDSSLVKSVFVIDS